MLFLMIWVILSQLIFTGILIALDAADIVDIDVITASPWYMICIQLIILLLPLFIWLSMKADVLANNIPSKNLSAKNIILIIAISLFIQPAMMTLSGISSLFFTNHVSEMMYTFMEQPLWLIILATAVTPAVCEELVFRGYVQTKHSDRNIKQAAILNGLFFAIIHLSIQQFAYAFVMGIIFAYMVYYTRSIWAGILSHFVVNATQSIMGRWAFASTEATERLIPSLSPEVEAVIIIGNFALFLTPIVRILFKKFFLYNKNQMSQETSDRLPVSSPEDPINDTNETCKEPIISNSPPMIDKYVIAIITIYIAFQALLIFA